MSGEINIHASCVAIGGAGVLLLGPSGSGKSDLALRLIDGGAKLVADDRTLVMVKSGRLHASAPATIRGLIEIRGVGIVAMPVRASAPIALVVELGREGARLPPPRQWKPPRTLAGAPKPAIFPPLLMLDARLPSTPARIRAALAAHARGTFRDTFNQG